MRYKTTIEIITDAENKNEALDIAGDYLSGHLMYGVDMRCLTRPVGLNKSVVVSVVAISMVMVALVFSAAHLRFTQNIVNSATGYSAIQPPLKTSIADKNGTEFKREWQIRQIKTALDHLTK